METDYQVYVDHLNFEQKVELRKNLIKLGYNDISDYTLSEARCLFLFKNNTVVTLSYVCSKYKDYELKDASEFLQNNYEYELW